MLAFPIGQDCVQSVFKILDYYKLILIKKVINFQQWMNLKMLRGLWTNQGKVEEVGFEKDENVKYWINPE
jgi:hypothetical protein